MNAEPISGDNDMALNSQLCLLLSGVTRYISFQRTRGNPLSRQTSGPLHRACHHLPAAEGPGEV